MDFEAAEQPNGGALAALGSADEPAAAGSAAALTGAVAAAVVCKAARATPRPASAAQAVALQKRLLRLARADADVLAAARSALDASAALAPDERRDFALGLALRNASEVPTSIAEACADVAQLAAAERAEVDHDFAADVTAAAILAAGAARAASCLVEANLLADESQAQVRSARRAAATAADLVARLAGL